MTGPKLLVGLTGRSSLVRARISAALVADGLAVTEEPWSATPGVAVLVLDGPLSGRVDHAIEACDGVRVVAVVPSMASVPRSVFRGKLAGLVLEDEIDTALPVAVRAVGAGFRVIPVDSADVLDKPAFSPRERQVLRLAVEGSTNCEIAAALFLAESTVKSHLSTAFRKLGVRSRKEACRLVLDPDEGLSPLVFGPVPVR